MQNKDYDEKIHKKILKYRVFGGPNKGKKQIDYEAFVSLVREEKFLLVDSGQIRN